MIFQNQKSNSIFLLLIFLSCFYSINSGSLWLDEILTVKIYSQPNLSEMFNLLFDASGSEIQMPGWMIFMWGWSRIFGISEYALRSANFIFIICLIFYFYRVLSSGLFDKKELTSLRIAFMLSIINPFILYNMNEARVNIPMYSFSFITILNLLLYLKTKNNKYFRASLVFFFIGYFFNMLFAFLIFPIITYLLLKRKTFQIIKNNIYRITIFIKSLIPLSV